MKTWPKGKPLPHFKSDEEEWKFWDEWMIDPDDPAWEEVEVEKSFKEGTMKYAGTVEDLTKMGIVLHQGKLEYGWKHGRLMWLPKTAQRLIVHTWNVCACRILGHDPFTYPDDTDRAGETVCVSCCKRL